MIHIGWVPKDFEEIILICQVGSHFEALDELVFLASSDCIAIYFILTLLFELCGAKPGKCHFLHNEKCNSKIPEALHDKCETVTP